MDRPPPTAAEFAAAVHTAAEGTPYAVVPTPTGFDVGVDPADARWSGPLSQGSYSTSITHHVQLQGKTFVVTDDTSGLSTQVGPTGARFSLGRSLGKLSGRGFQRTWAPGTDGGYRKVVDAEWDVAAGRHLVQRVGAELGLRQRRGTAEKVGLVAALIGVGSAVVAGVAVLVIALTGGF